MSKVEIDDVAYALTGKVKLATQSITVNIPPIYSTTSGRRARKISVSDAGEKLLGKETDTRDKALAAAAEAYDQGVEKLKAEREERERKAWEGMNKIIDAVDSLKEMSKNARGGNNDDDDEEDDSPEADTGSDNAQQQQDAPASPSSDAGYQAAPQHDQYGGGNNWGG